MIWESWRYISIYRVENFKKLWQKFFKMIIKASKVSIKIISESLKKMKSFMKI